MANALRGQLLIASRKLRDPNFFKTVVLMVEHGDHGAMGLVINRPSSVTVTDALAGHFEFPDSREVVYIGGPVEPAALFLLHDSQEMDVGEPPIVPGVFVGSSGTAFEHVIRSVADGTRGIRYRVVCGCAGWAPGQLEGEIGRGDWLLAPASAEFAFPENPYVLWNELMQQQSQRKPIVRRTTDHPEWN